MGAARCFQCSSNLAYPLHSMALLCNVSAACLNMTCVMVMMWLFPWCAFGAPKLPLYGWCAGKHSPRVPAQSGYADARGNRYCKTCYKVKFPKKYEAKQLARQKRCQRCGRLDEVVGGYCRRCLRAYQCRRCQRLCATMEPARCVHCAEHVALWCRTCHGAEA